MRAYRQRRPSAGKPHFRKPFRNQTGSGTTAEFAPALIIFFLVILFPMINLIMFACGVGTAYLATKQAASRAGTQATFSEALSVVQQESNYFQASGFGQFAKLQGVGGVGGSGINLSVLATPYGGGAITQFTANSPITGTADPTANTYEFRVDATYTIGPFMDMSMIPWIGGVPGLGPPAQMTFSAASTAEFPEGLGQ